MSIDRIDCLIYEVRGQKVMLDSDLAGIYGVPTKRLNEAVKRNPDRFPLDFVFQLTREEVANLKSQIATSSLGHGGKRKLPRVFTEHGALMAANVLNSRQAVQMNARSCLPDRPTAALNREGARLSVVPVS